MKAKTMFVCFVLFILILSSPWKAPVLGNGGKAKTVVYFADLPVSSESGQVNRFRIEVNPVLFYFTTLNNKYYVLSIRLQNRSKVPLILSKSQDSAELKFGSETIPAFLDLVSKDSKTWDGLQLSIRKAVVYPNQVEPGEEEGIYVYVPIQALGKFIPTVQMPTSVSFKISSISKSVELKQPVAAAKM